MPRAQHKISQPSPSDRRGQTLYEQDFYAWVGEQVEALRSGHTQGLDIENLAEEIEDVGRSQRRAVKSALIIILIHLLKYRHQPQHRTNSWRQAYGSTAAASAMSWPTVRACDRILNAFLTIATRMPVKRLRMKAAYLS